MAMPKPTGGRTQFREWVQTSLRKYITDRHDEIIKGFPATFLDIDPVSDEMITKVAEKIEPKVLDNLMLQLIKQHYGKVGVFLLVVAAVVAGTFIGLWSQFGLTVEQVRSLVKTVIEQQVVRPPAK